MGTTFHVTLLLHIVVTYVTLDVTGLKNVRLRASEAVKTGEKLRLSCSYDLESVPLYSVKWYFGDNEFYRYVPKESPPTRVFPLDGFNVDTLLRTAQQLLFTDVLYTELCTYKSETLDV